ncbi:MAG TPA: flagellin [Syntrophorhabdaceae bacterium]|nr:flagellin [Syntrophorhabdaceae bacterium]HPL41417.1 flagellin [Syntrophorhabdaceae bacterium]HQJ94452.1 flagellin [Syntrophorhabdaceae bacterium]
MAFRIATNTASVNTQRWLGIANAGQTKALERLSSGYKINSAKDDAAGIAIAAKLSVKAVALTKSVDSGNQALAMLQTAEGGIDQISNILTRLKSIATQSASANTVDRAALDVERGKLESQIDNIAKNTRYGDKELLNGTGSTLGAITGASITLANGISGIDVSGSSFTSNVNATLTITGTSATLAIGDSTQSVTFSKPLGINLGEINFSDFGVKVTVNAAITDIPTAGGGFVINAGTNSTFEYQLGDQNIDQNRVSVSLANFTKGGSTLALSGDISDAGKAKLYMDKIDAAIGKLTTERGKVGAAMNQISYQVANLETMYENTKAAVSTIMDADFASEMAEFTKFQILNQSGVAMLAQANQIPQMILSLLK